MFTEMLNKINRYLEEREEKNYQKLQRELEEEYGDPEEAPEVTYEEVEVNDNEDSDEVDMNIQDSIYEETAPVNEEIEMNIQEPIEEEMDMNVIPKKKKGIHGFFQNLKKNKKETTPVNEEINMNVQEPTEEEIDMNVIPKKKKGIRSIFQNLKRNKKETTPVNEEINMNIQEPTEEEIDMNVIPKKKKGIRGIFQNLKNKKKGIRDIFQNLKAKVMKKSNSELKESTTKMDIANATLFTIIQGIILTGTIVVGVMNPAVGFLAGILATGCSLAVIADIKDVMMKVKEYKTSQPVQEENYEEIDEELEQDISTEKANTEEPIISYSFTKNGPEIAEVDLSNIHTEPGLHINQELFGFKNESADIKHFVVNREDEEVSNYVANEIENVTGMEPIYNDYTVEDNEKRVYVLTR